MTAAPGSFWARRKAAVQAEAEAEAAAARAAALAETEAAEQARRAEMTDAEILAELGLKDPDEMGQGDDFAAFLSRAVPEHLRRRALRRLWRSNPVLANLDGLVDHGEDYSDAATVLPDMKTTYQVGKGLLRHVVALAEAKEAAAHPAPAPAADLPSEIADQTADQTADAFPHQGIAAAPLPDMAAAGPDDTAPRAPRHMRFAFAAEG